MGGTARLFGGPHGGGQQEWEGEGGTKHFTCLKTPWGRRIQQSDGVGQSILIGLVYGAQRSLPQRP